MLSHEHVCSKKQNDPPDKPVVFNVSNSSISCLRAARAVDGLDRKTVSRFGCLQFGRDSDFANARRFDIEIPRSLVMICQKAMSYEIADRYTTSRELAIDVERWLADERVIAFGAREPVGEMIGRLMRRYRRWTVPVAASCTRFAKAVARGCRE